MKKPRKARAPLDPMAMFRPMPISLQEKHELMQLSALQSIATAATPDRDDWNELADVCNVVESLIVMKQINDDHWQTLRPAVDAMKAAARRYTAGQRLGMTGPELEAMRAICLLYRECCARLSHMTIHRATLHADKEAKKAWQSGRVARGEAVVL
ncbi:MAG: hypothetical protein IIZ92_15600 [Aquincola sp.]|nr:hypothetical protein [Aquincola sp.]